MDPQQLNDFSTGRIESVDDNTRVPECETSYALTSASWKKVRDNLETVLREIESNIYQSRKQPIEHTEDTSIKHGSSYSHTKDETCVRQPNRETGNKVGSEQVYSRHIKCGDRNFMLICEPKNEPHEKVVYKQEGNTNIMINLRVSSNAYQLVEQVKHSRNMQVIPLDSEGEVWLEIKRHSQVESRKKSRSPGTNESIYTDTTSSESDNLQYDTHDLLNIRDVDEHGYQADHNDNSKRPESRSIEENAYVFNTKDSNESNDSQYEIISISEDKDLLKMRFSKPRDGQLEDLERLFLSHHRVCDFLRDSFNDFDASICDWMYQSEYIEGGIKPELIYSPGIQDCEWYRSQLSNEGAKKELKNKPPGAFLVRQATTNTAEPGGSLHVFTLEFVDEHGRIKKLMIMKTGDVYHFKEFLTQKHEIQTFETVSDLVAKVLTSGLEIKDSRTKLLTIFHVKPVWRNT